MSLRFLQYLTFTAKASTSSTLPPNGNGNFNNGCRTSNIDVSRTFIAYNNMLDYVNACATNQNFKVTVKASVYWNQQPVRGSFVCSPKSCGRKSVGVVSDCSFRLKFNHCAKSKQYRFMPPFQLDHDHSLSSDTVMMVNGKQVVKFESDLTDSEASAIEAFSIAGYSVPQLETVLERIYPNRLYHKTLLNRLRGKFLDESIGKDRNNLPALAGLAEHVIRDGGTFRIVPDPESMGIKCIHIQTRSMRGYAVQYGPDSVKMVDGSHHWSKHQLTACPWTGIDCFGFNFVYGITYSPTENSEDLIDGAGLIFSVNSPTTDSSTTKLDSLCEFIAAEEDAGPKPMDQRIDTLIDPNSTIMADEGPAFIPVARAIDCHIIKDRKHKTAKILHSWQKVPEELRASYQNDIHSILNSATPQVFEELMARVSSQYPQPEVQAFLQSILEDKDKLVWCWTGKYFTFGHVSDQRAESTNSCQKGKGTLNHTLKTAPLFNSIKRFFMVGTEWERKALEQLKKHRLKSEFISDLYREHLRTSMANVISYSYASPISPGSSTYIIKESADSAEFFTVNLNGLMKFRGELFRCFTCDCLFFSSTNMMCPHVCRAAQEARVVIPQAEQIAPFHLLYNHPRYYDACVMLGLPTQMNNLPNPMPNHFNAVSTTLSSTPSSCSNGTEDAVSMLNSDMYDQLGSKYDSLPKPDRVMKFRAFASKMENLAAKSSTHFKIAICELSGLQNKLSNLNISGPSLNVALDSITRARTRGRPAKGELDNKSYLQREGKKAKTVLDGIDFSFGSNVARKKTPAKPRCSRCLEAGRSDEECRTHIRTSKDCPSREPVTMLMGASLASVTHEAQVNMESAEM